VITTLCLLGALLAASACVIGWRRIKQKKLRAAERYVKDVDAEPIEMCSSNSEVGFKERKA
jgi:hypothetical protein